MIKTKVYICLSGMFDEHVDLITTNIEVAYCYADNSKKLIDIREYEATIDTIHWTRPDRPEKIEPIAKYKQVDLKTFNKHRIPIGTKEYQ